MTDAIWNISRLSMAKTLFSLKEETENNQVLNKLRFGQNSPYFVNNNSKCILLNGK